MENDFFKKESGFLKAKDKYGVWPITVWEIDYSDDLEQDLKKQIGDGTKNFTRSSSWKNGGVVKKGAGKLGYSTRKNVFANTFRGNTDTKSQYQLTESIFSPQICTYILNCYAPKQGNVFDPFAGGGTRAICSAIRGLNYTGYEIRKEEVDAVLERCKLNKVDQLVNIIEGTSSDCKEIKDDSMDFLITCPPYFNMEQYDGGENDLSMATSYSEFLINIKQNIKESYRVLKSGSLSCWVIGLHRDNNELLSIPADIANLHKEVGFKHKEEVILFWKGNGLLRRAGNFEKGNKFLIRTHEYLEVFVK